VTPTVWGLVALTVAILIAAGRIGSALDRVNGTLSAYLDAVSTYLHDIQGSLSDMSWNELSKPEPERRLPEYPGDPLGRWSTDPDETP
jgi:hypothetical protein